jgi:hypothetical protein
VSVRSLLALAVLAASLLAPGGMLRAEPRAVTVYKTSTCGCCSRWVDHFRAEGFPVVAHDVADLDAMKAQQGVPLGLRSCHTALVEGYVVEGHVPAPVVERLLRERPRVSGLAVPGMPVGSPGMEGGRPEPYEVLAFDAGGRVAVYSRHPAP